MTSLLPPSEPAPAKPAAEPPPSDKLPGYAHTLAAYHRAFAPELAAAVAALPVRRHGQALDLPCGDGFFSACLADRGLRVTACDLSPAFLRLAERTCRLLAGRAVQFIKANAYDLPFGSAQFDLVWCAQSLISLTGPVKVLAEMRRVVRPGGLVAVLETDELHHLLLNWPADLDAAVQRATVAAAAKRYGGADRLSPSRWVGRAMLAAGLRDIKTRTVAADRQAPFDPATADFVRIHLDEMRGRVKSHLSPEQLAEFDRFPGDGATLTCLNTLFVARK